MTFGGHTLDQFNLSLRHITQSEHRDVVVTTSVGDKNVMTTFGDLKMGSRLNVIIGYLEALVDLSKRTLLVCLSERLKTLHTRIILLTVRRPSVS